MDIIDNRTDRIFTADYAKKTVIVPKDEQVIGVKGDSRGRAIRFELLKVPDELDLSQCVIEVQYQNALGETGRQKVLHLEESQTDGTKRIFFYFRPPLSLTKAAGTVYLQVCGTYAYTSGSYYHWHLAPAAVEIADFFDCEETALADPKDDLTIQIQADIASLETQMDEIKSTLNNLAGTGDEVSENMVAEIAAVKNRVTNLESGKLNKSDAQTLYATKEEAETLGEKWVYVGSDTPTNGNLVRFMLMDDLDDGPGPMKAMVIFTPEESAAFDMTVRFGTGTHGLTDIAQISNSVTPNGPVKCTITGMEIDSSNTMWLTEFGDKSDVSTVLGPLRCIDITGTIGTIVHVFKAY